MNLQEFPWMPVGHGGGMSSHPAWVKIAILELLEERLKVAAVEAGYSEDVIHVFDPFTTDMDFYIRLDVDWDGYLKIYSKYYDRDLKTDAIKNIVEKYHENDLPESIRRKSVAALEKASILIEKYDEDKIFNASTSKSEIFYTIDEMKYILEYGTPNP